MLFSFIIQPILQISKALRDELEDVREAAAQAFDRLYRNIGNKAIDEIIPGKLASTSFSICELAANNSII